MLTVLIKRPTKGRGLLTRRTRATKATRAQPKARTVPYVGKRLKKALTATPAPQTNTVKGSRATVRQGKAFGHGTILTTVQVHPPKDRTDSPKVRRSQGGYETHRAPSLCSPGQRRISWDEVTEVPQPEGTQGPATGTMTGIRKRSRLRRTQRRISDDTPWRHSTSRKWIRLRSRSPIPLRPRIRPPMPPPIWSPGNRAFGFRVESVCASNPPGRRVDRGCGASGSKEVRRRFSLRHALPRNAIRHDSLSHRRSRCRLRGGYPARRDRCGTTRTPFRPLSRGSGTGPPAAGSASGTVLTTPSFTEGRVYGTMRPVRRGAWARVAASTVLVLAAGCTSGGRSTGAARVTSPAGASTATSPAGAGTAALPAAAGAADHPTCQGLGPPPSEGAITFVDAGRLLSVAASSSSSVTCLLDGVGAGPALRWNGPADKGTVTATAVRNGAFLPLAGTEMASASPWASCPTAPW